MTAIITGRFATYHIGSRITVMVARAIEAAPDKPIQRDDCDDCDGVGDDDFDTGNPAGETFFKE